jgi:RimJ/RimL family protein N-acetyltransferase
MFFLIEKAKCFYRKKRTKLIGINYYIHFGGKSYTNNNHLFQIISEYDEFADFMRCYSINITEFDQERFGMGDKFACLFDSEKILSYGWICNKDRFYISEIEVTVSNIGTVMLYDFFTPEQLRNRGFYTELLKKIINHYSSEKLAIFALKSNKPSIKAIEKAGFKISSYKAI